MSKTKDIIPRDPVTGEIDETEDRTMSADAREDTSPAMTIPEQAVEADELARIRRFAKNWREIASDEEAAPTGSMLRAIEFLFAKVDELRGNERRGPSHDAILALLAEAAEWHDLQSVMADGFDCAESAKYHEAEMKKYQRAVAALSASPPPVAESGWQEMAREIIEKCAKVAEQQTSWSVHVEETDHNSIYTGNYRSEQRTGPRWCDGKAIASAIRAIPAPPYIAEKRPEEK
jgi:hypothetical protein